MELLEKTKKKIKNKKVQKSSYCLKIEIVKSKTLKNKKIPLNNIGNEIKLGVGVLDKQNTTTAKEIKI